MLIWSAGVVAILALAAWVWLAEPVTAPEPTTGGVEANDTMTAIDAELQGINVADQTQDIQSTSADANSL